LILNDNAKEIIKSRYLWVTKGETEWDDIAKRVGSVVGGGSTPSDVYTDSYIEMLSEGWFIAGGRINRNAGRPRGSMFNCYNVPIGDSIEEITDAYSACMRLWKDGGGTGLTFSDLRPSGAPLISTEGESSGPMPFLWGLNEAGRAIRTGGQRRAAGLALLAVSHPNIMDFITCKQNDGDYDLFNLSVGITEEFIDAVREDKEWNLTWRNKVFDTIPARDLWSAMVKGLSNNGEPGIINMDNLCSNNSYYFAPIIGTNPCGETCLEAWGVCNLGSLVLKHFVSGSRIQWKKLEEVIHLAIRFLDSCIDVNLYTLPEVKITAQRGRRVGLGVMGLADMFLGLGVRYGSRESLDVAERLFKFIRNVSYEASIKLAIEKGTFPAFEPTPYCKAKFIRTLPPSLRQSIRKHGTRNVTLMAMAPTGTISLVPECSGGIEPIPYLAYKRKDYVSERFYIHPAYKEALLSGKAKADYLVDSTDLRPIDHIEIQSVIQRYTDGAVSKTIYIAEDESLLSLSDVLLESISDLKGVTVYRDGSREGQPLVPLSIDEALKVVRNEKDVQVADADTLVCASGKCEI
jgi:ribonucleoside-diphosphate reductase alpha chain